MKDLKGFLKIKRLAAVSRPVCERVKDYGEVMVSRPVNTSRDQSSRCMDCGTPFCHWGCPIGNYIPEWNDLVASGHWKDAWELLRTTNNLPEITGRLCPAPCEYACVLGINDDPVTIRDNELAIIEYAFAAGMMKPRIPKIRRGHKIAVIGSGPAGLACADQLNQAGHKVTVYERYDRPGGIMRYGIPDFKLDKSILERRINLLMKEGIKFECCTDAGRDIAADSLLKDFNAVCLTGGCRVPRDLEIEGRELSGIHFAMDYLIQSNRRALGEKIPEDISIDAKGKNVVVIGGGDTGADCVGTARRQGALCVVQVELLPQPATCRTDNYPWPVYPMLLKTSTSHEEGCVRHWSMLTKRFIGKNGAVKKLSCIKVEFRKSPGDGCHVMHEVAGSQFDIDADLVILAVGFSRPEAGGLLKNLGISLDEKGTVRTGTDYMTSVKGVFCAGDMRRGQSLIVWAISEGRRAAHSIDGYLMGKSYLPII